MLNPPIRNCNAFMKNTGETLIASVPTNQEYSFPFLMDMNDGYADLNQVNDCWAANQ